jgi:molybdopterin-containing oxidoreductase family iron-sulfur binding subunit
MEQNHSQTDSGQCPVSRRHFLKGAAGVISALALGACDAKKLEELMQKHFHEMSKEELARAIARLESEYAEKYKTAIKVDATGPMEHTLFGYALDLSRCIGCRRCVYACVKENNLPREPQIHWIRVLELDKEKGVDLAHANSYYDAETVPREGHFYMPVACQHCKHPPCVKSCPVSATWKEPDGIVVIDSNWCIGCRCCMAACPYGARHFNWADPQIPPNEINTNTHYLGNRPRYKGIVEKCSYCIQRTRQGLYPACVEICPVGARKFGNLLDPESEIRYAMETKRVFILKEELNTQPSFFYFYSL